MLLKLLKWDLKNTTLGFMITLIRILYSILKSLLHITLLIVILTWTEI